MKSNVRMYSYWLTSHDAPARIFVLFLAINKNAGTPLNTVCMGLELLQGDLRRAQLEKEKSSMKGSPASEKERVLSTTEAKEEISMETVEKPQSKENEFATLYWLDLAGDIWDNTKNAVAVLNDLLNYDKIESGTLKLEVGEVPIWDLIHKVVGEFQIQAKNKHVALNFKTVIQPGSLSSGMDHHEVPSENIKYAEEKNLKQLQVVGDDMRLRQVARNLISNALKFTQVRNGLSILFFVSLFISYLSSLILGYLKTHETLFLLAAGAWGCQCNRKLHT